ncbi:sulfotransferase domain-containing protein [Verrucomicrobiaceae bacterium R5-34]|nr:sulfotransferase domain-containing protein [Verrucomicrobiaceae bacterium R5-34]
MKHNVKWLIERGSLWGRSILQLQKTEAILLVGYPKTGSTWLRYYLFLLMCQKRANFDLSIDRMNDLMPEFAHESFFREWFYPQIPVLLKTHQKYYSFFKRHKALLVVRDPRDIVVSYYHYSKGVKNIDYDGSFSDLLRHPSMGLESFFKHYYSWKDNADMVLRYEDFKDDPTETFSKLSEFCKLTTNVDEIQQAITGAGFKNMKAIQSRSGKLRSEFKEGHQFVRSGKKAQWIDLFTVDDLAYYNLLKEKYNFHLYE